MRGAWFAVLLSGCGPLTSQTDCLQHFGRHRGNQDLFYRHHWQRFGTSYETLDAALADQPERVRRFNGGVHEEAAGLSLFFGGPPIFLAGLLLFGIGGQTNNPPAPAIGIGLASLGAASVVLGVALEMDGFRRKQSVVREFNREAEAAGHRCAAP